MRTPTSSIPPTGASISSPTPPASTPAGPLSRPSGVDLDGNVRRLDGDLDRVLRVDMGAYEFSNVRLAASGSAWSDLFVETTGTPGLDVWLVVGRGPGESQVATWGHTLFDVNTLWFAFPLGTTPDRAHAPDPHGRQSAGTR